MTIGPDSRWLVAADGEIAHLWDLDTPNVVQSRRALRGHDQIIWTVKISSDGRWLITDGSDGTVRRWSLDVDWLMDYARRMAGREMSDEERVYYNHPMR